MSTRIQVVSAVIMNASRVLLTQRDPMRSGHGWLWESPGGKVEPGETFALALQRELREEIDVDVLLATDVLASFDFEPTNEGRVMREHPISVNFMRVVGMSGTPRARQALGIGWFGPTELATLPLIPGNDRFRNDLIKILLLASHV